MNFKPTYLVHIAESLDSPDNPVIVTTVYTNAGGYPKGEWFLFVPEGAGALFAQRTRLDYTTFPEGPVVFDEAFLLDDLLNQAKLRLRRYVIETKAERAAAFLSRRPEVLPSNQNIFVNLWMHGTHQTHLITIARKTECEPLSEFLRWVTSLPVLSSSDL